MSDEKPAVFGKPVIFGSDILRDVLDALQIKIPSQRIVLDIDINGVVEVYLHAVARVDDKGKGLVEVLKKCNNLDDLGVQVTVVNPDHTVEMTPMHELKIVPKEQP